MEERRRKSHFRIVLAAVVLLGILILPALAMEEKTSAAGIVVEENSIASGNVTDTVTWRITEDDAGNHTLVIGGTGPMADYKNQSEQPWQGWKNTISALIVEDEVTRIGNYSMYGLGFREVRIGKGVEAIGKYSFAYGTHLESVCIPGNVKIVEANAFVYHFALVSVILEEGVEVLEHSSFGTQVKKGSPVHIPSSVKRIDDLAIWNASEYTVEEDNPYFTAADGVLYDKEITALVDYPKMKKAVEYRTPDSVCEIRKGAFHRIKETKKIVIASSVQVLPETYLFHWSEMEEVYIEDGVPVSGSQTFYASSKLVRVRLPENMPINRIYSMFEYECNCLESLKLPSGVQKIEYIGKPLKALKEITYDAANAQIKDNPLLDPDITYHLIIGEQVDYLPAKFKWFTDQADSIIFQGPNLFFVEDGAFQNRKSPVKGLTGTIYVDEQGILYLCDTESQTAKVVYCQEGADNVFIPGVIRPDAETSCIVTSVGKDAFKYAGDLQSIVFENPGQIQSVEAYGFANCPMLSMINRLSDIEEMAALFSEAKIGYRAFYNTGLSGTQAEEPSGEEIKTCKEIVVKRTDGISDMVVSVQSEGGTLEWVSEEEETGKYRLLTGDALTIQAAAGNREAAENHRYRVYFQSTDESCSLSVSAGQQYVFDDQSVECHATEDPNCVYIEFSPNVGKTLSIPVTAVYPSPGTKGGSLLIWAVVLDKLSAQEQAGSILLPEQGMIQAEWKTIRDNFTISKTSTGATSITLMGTEDGVVVPGKDLWWKLVTYRSGDTTSAYGKNYVKSVTYKETLELPEGLSWKEEVITAMKNESARRSGQDWYAGTRKVCSISLSGGQVNLSGVRLSWDEEAKTGVISYTVTNSVKDAQMNTSTINCTMYADAFEADVLFFSDGKEQKIVSCVEARVNYQHSASEVLTSKAEKTVKAGSGSMNLSKTTVTKPYYFGEDVDYDIVLSNPGAMRYQSNEGGSWTLKDVLSSYVYIESEDMEQMFLEDADKALSIHITGTERKEWTKQQGVLEDTVFWENGSNSGENLMVAAAEQIEIGWNSSGTGLCVKAGETVYEEDTLAESLKQAGFAAGRWSEYVLNWRLNREEEMFALAAGETRRFHVYARAKDTFQMLSEDWPTAYPTDAALTLTSTASVVDGNQKTKAGASAADKVIREAYLKEQASINNRILKDSFTAEEGECITYTLEFCHYGKGDYSNLPIAGEMYGAQALLVPVDENPELMNAGLEIFEKEGEQFFILTEGNYSNVKVGDSSDGTSYIAAKITVEEVEKEKTVQNGGESHNYNGLYTRIQWNWASIPSGRYKLYLSYHALVDQNLSGKNVYSLGNVFWMNNRQNSRIYGSLWGGGTMIDFSLDIIAERGQDWQEDVTDEDGYSLVSAGEQVTYRLMLQSKGNGSYSVNGSDIAEQLPIGGGVFDWIRNENVTMSYVSTHNSTTVSNLDQWRVADAWNEQTEEGQQYILWPDETNITFRENDARVYIYVTLTYPENTGEESDWQAYLRTINGGILENTYFVYQFPVNVTHHLSEPGQVLMQKGVYGTSYEIEEQYKEVKNRNYYNNKDSRNRQITYYLLLYNGGTKRWYLNDIYDNLPDGFSFKKLVNDSNLNKVNNTNSIMTLTEFDEYSFIEKSSNITASEDIAYRSAAIQWSQTEEGLIRFRIGEGEGSQAVSYDEQRQQYYLNQNEAIVFGYMCEIGLMEETEDTACNTVFMYYTDYPRTSVKLVNENRLRFSGALNEVHGDRNDGNCSILNGSDIKKLYGIFDGDKEDMWLLSDASIRRGEIIPGITKYTQSYTTPGSGITTEYVNAAGPYDEINWRVRLHNSGTLAITDYMFEDVLPNGYALCGTLRYEICDYLGNFMAAYELAKFSEHTEDSVAIYNYNSKQTVSLNGEPVEINISMNERGSLSVDKDGEGREILTIHFSNHTVSIPEGGYMDLYLSCYNPTNQYKNTVYTNHAVLTPVKQEFHMAGQGSLIRDEAGNGKSVRNSSPVTIAFGYATGSEKGVEEKGTGNRAVSTDTNNNYIVLSSKDSLFQYSLTVTNDTDLAMKKLVFIDNLPQEGDVSPFDSLAERNSEFKIRMANDANLRVTISTENGASYDLKEGEFEIGFSNQTVFDEDDWNGSAMWNGEISQAKALRILIKDDTGVLIPAKAQVNVSFDCMVDGEAKAGETAWNSFGYRYRLLGLNQELEAMPLKVGVKIAEVPKLKKSLTDPFGSAQTAAEDAVFRFLIYEGSKIYGDAVTEEELIDFLEEDGTNYMTVSAAVKEGDHESELIVLDSMDWKDGETYTICELQNSDSYALDSMNGQDKEVVHFTYGKDKELVLDCVNSCLKWSIELLKTDVNQPEKPLKDAVFALYSTKEEAESASENPVKDDLVIDQRIEAGSQTWYLTSVKTTDSDGKISWTDLTEEQYYVMEVQAPDGYNRQEEGWIVYRRNADEGICSMKIANEPGLTLPNTGGIGTDGFILVGAFLGIAACMMKEKNQTGRQNLMIYKNLKNKIGKKKKENER